MACGMIGTLAGRGEEMVKAGARAFDPARTTETGEMPGGRASCEPDRRGVEPAGDRIVSASR